MGTFFECNLPAKAPSYLHKEIVGDFQGMLERVRVRMTKLDKALDIAARKSGICGEQFSIALGGIFNKEHAVQPIDAMTPAKIAEIAIALGVGKEFIPRMEWPNARVLVDAAFLTTKEWEMVRMLGIGGSDMATVMDDQSPFKTKRGLYHDKIGTPAKLRDNDTGKQFIFAYGHKMESLVISEFCRLTGAKVIPETRILMHKTIDYLLANIDAVVLMPDGSIAIFEAKTTTFFNKDKWAGTKVPVYYVPQCRHYPVVTNDDRVSLTYIGCIFGNTPDDFICQSVFRDKNAEALQIECAVDFWTNHILCNKLPDHKHDPEKDIEVIRKYEAGLADKSLPPVELPEELLENIEAYLELERQKDVLKARMDGLEDEMKEHQRVLVEHLGAATKAVLPTGIKHVGKLLLSEDEELVVSWSPRSYTGINRDKLQKLFPDAFRACVITYPEKSRTFNIKKISIRKKGGKSS